MNNELVQLTTAISADISELRQELEPIYKEAQAIAATAKAMEITDETSAEAAAKIVALHRTLTAIRDGVSAPIEEAVATIRRKVISWKREVEARLQAEAARRAEEERKMLEAAAKKLQRKDSEAAEELRARAETVVPERVVVRAPIKTRKIWRAKIVDEDAFFAQLARAKELRGYVEIKLAALARAKAANTMLEINGVSFYEEDV